MVMNSTKDASDCIFWTPGHLNPLNFDSSSFFYVSRAVVTINCLSSPVSAIGNGLVLLTILTTVSLQNPSNVLIASLALSDFLIGLIMQPLFTAVVLHKSLFLSCTYQDSITFIGFLCSSISATLMAAVSCERYMALFLHLRYNTLVTIKRVILVVLGIWIYWIVDSSAFFPGGVAFILGQIFCTLAWLLSSFAISFSYFKIFGLVRHHRRQIHSQQTTDPKASVSSSQTKMAITMGYVIWASLLCYMPTTMVFQWFMFSKNPNSALFNAFYMTMTIQFMSSSFNPVIYCWRRKDIRLATISMLKNAFCCSNDTLNPTGYSSNVTERDKETSRVA